MADFQACYALECRFKTLHVWGVSCKRWMLTVWWYYRWTSLCCNGAITELSWARICCTGERRVVIATAIAIAIARHLQITTTGNSRPPWCSNLSEHVRTRQLQMKNMKGKYDIIGVQWETEKYLLEPSPNLMILLYLHPSLSDLKICKWYGKFSTMQFDLHAASFSFQ